MTRRFARTVEDILLASHEERIRETRGVGLSIERSPESGHMRAVIADAAERRTRKAERMEHIARLRDEGLTTKEIAQRMNVGERYVRHYESAFRKRR